MDMTTDQWHWVPYNKDEILFHCRNYIFAVPYIACLSSTAEMHCLPTICPRGMKLRDYVSSICMWKVHTTTSSIVCIDYNQLQSDDTEVTAFLHVSNYIELYLTTTFE